MFQVFGVLQKRAICSSAALKMMQGDFQRHSEAIRHLTPKDFEVTAGEESWRVPFSNPVMNALVKHLHTVRSNVIGTDSSRTSVRSQIWSLVFIKNPPNLWITLNPSDINNPIAQVFAGELLDLDNFNPSRALDSKLRAQNIARNPYAAAKFFNFVIVATLETIFGISSVRGNITWRSGVFGNVNAYMGMIETQGRGMLHLHLIVWLADAPKPSLMRDCLKADEFHAKVVEFIKANIKADVGMSEAEFLTQRVKPAITFNRPIPPSDKSYSRKTTERLRLLLRAVQVHSCEIGRCIVTRKKRLVCKNRAPFKLSDKDWVAENGEWGMRRVVAYLNGFNPTISETLLCNHDVKLVTNGDETQDMTMYATNYSSKQQRARYWQNGTHFIPSKRRPLARLHR